MENACERLVLLQNKGQKPEINIINVNIRNRQSHLFVKYMYTTVVHTMVLDKQVSKLLSKFC